ncbi:CbiX/SirB N-terminal domain-containing protein [Crassaminicella indica]|uniref:Ferrochelatase n=1 Tax=Crassaminicella indica TaxID=2855394 RepID=A0ABX8RDK5_9CLOT|nr:CbiX/SirB N-terminal domain-containing protein [Crassaminicella indica]QXM05800.1 hypothetical protein KVH43_10600 [Crassaminicella indica]
MKAIENLKVLFLSIVFSIFSICYLVSFGFLERLSVAILTIFFCIFIKNIKKVKLSYICTVLCGMIVGILLCNYVLFFFEYKEECKNEFIYKEENENTAVLLVYDGEPERYDLPILLKNMNRKYSLKENIFLPLRLYRYKRVYEKVGISRYNYISRSIGQKLSNHLDDGYDIYISYLNNKPYYEEVFYEKVLKQKYKKIIIVPVFLTESINYKNIVHKLEMDHLYNRKNILKFMNPLWNGEKIIKSIVQEACNEDGEKKEMGIILIGSMDIMVNKDIEPKAVNQQRLFMEKIKKGLIKNGFEERKIKFLRQNLNDSEINNILGELQQYGVGKILFIGIDDILDKIENQYKIEKSIEKIKRTEELDIKYMKGWGESDLVIEELEFRIRLLNVEKWN